jgi:hypothetical protein
MNLIPQDQIFMKKRIPLRLIVTFACAWLPCLFAAVPATNQARPDSPGRQPFPAHWGEPPDIQTMDYRPLPGGYGFGSSTLASWIGWQLTIDEAKAKGLILEAKDFPVAGTGYYLDRDKWLAINPDQGKEARTQRVFPFPSGLYDVILIAVGEDDGRSTYEIFINDQVLGEFTCPLSDTTVEEGIQFSKRWTQIKLGSGDLVGVRSRIGSIDGQASSRGRWARLVFAAADDATKAAVAALEPVASPSAMAQDPALVQPRQSDGNGSVSITGELKQWHKVTLTLDGPYAHERDRQPNPFTDYNFTVTFRHESGHPAYSVPGYFAADGDAANTSAESGTKWRAHLAPDQPGKWTYTISFLAGEHAALGSITSPTLLSYSGTVGSFAIEPTDKQGRDFRARGRLQYVGQHHLRFAGTGEYFLKAGPDAPESLLAYADFDGTEPSRKMKVRSGEAPPSHALKTWEPHLRDWRPGDPTWKGDKGKGLIGALNYLAEKGVNAFSFLPYNAGGDGDNVWPFVARDQKLHYDCSKLDQWGVVFDLATAQGLYLHFKLQETEIDDDRLGSKGAPGLVPESLDGGRLGPERKLYCRELIARYAHNLALNWNIGEENSQSTEEITDMTKYLHDTDPYRHHIVIHTYPNQQDQVYTPLLGNNSVLTGASLQNSWSQAHQRTLKWVLESARAGKPWVVANDEQNPADMGVPPDPGYAGHSGEGVQGGKPYTLHDIRKLTLWGTLMAGGAGVEYYFGYKLPENDLLCEDWRSRDRSWDYCRIALEFFREHRIPFWEMGNANALVGNSRNDNSKFCLVKPDEVYLVYLPDGGTSDIDLSDAKGGFTVKWFNPRAGGPLREGSVRTVNAGGTVSLGQPPADPREDWLIVLRKEQE